MFWIGQVLGNTRETALAGGWPARAAQVLESQPTDCAEQGLLLGARAFQHNMASEFAEGRDLARRAVEIGRPGGHTDTLGLVLTPYGGALTRLGRPDEAVAALDEAMLAVVSAQISPIAAGTVYCAVISICQELAELRRAQQ